MKLGIMQPYFFPYLGYFDLIHYVDRFILFDTAQYIRHGWVNRNRILHPKQGWKYIIVPLQKHAQTTPICDIHVQADMAWQAKIVGQLDHYRKRAPYFDAVLSLVRETFAPSDTSLARLNGRGLQLICDYLKISFQAEYYSDLSLALGAVQAPGEWALEISHALGATHYVNPVGGEAIFEPSRFRQRGIDLMLRPFDNLVYTCRGYAFEPALSILDVLMWNSPQEIRAYLDERKQLHLRLHGDSAGSLPATSSSLADAATPLLPAAAVARESRDR